MKYLYFFILTGLLFSIAYASEDNILEIEKFVAQSSQNIQQLKDGITLASPESKGSLLSMPIALSSQFNACTVTWKDNSAGKICLNIRASNDGENWTKWEHIEQKEADILWKTGLFKIIQYRANLQIAENKAPILHKIVINFNHTPAATIEHMESMTGMSRETFRTISKPSIVSRSEWGARSPNGGYTNHTPNKITIHHTWRPTAADYTGNATIRSIQNYHMDTNGWADIGYHFLIGTYPTNGGTLIYQGRPENVIGAHTGGNNTNNVGVNAIGDYTCESLHSNTYDALIELLAWLCSKYNISPDSIYGHCDFGSTSCPGSILYGKIPQIRIDVRNVLQGR